MKDPTVLHLGGVPTKPDVDKLREKIGVPTENELITYTKVEEILGTHRTSNRFKTVTNQWRRAMFNEHHILIDAVPKDGFMRLDPDSHIQKSASKVKCGLGITSKGFKWARVVDASRLTNGNIKLKEHMNKREAAFLLAAATAPKQLGAG